MFEPDGDGTLAGPASPKRSTTRSPTCPRTSRSRRSLSAPAAPSRSPLPSAPSATSCLAALRYAREGADASLKSSRPAHVRRSEEEKRRPIALPEGCPAGSRPDRHDASTARCCARPRSDHVRAGRPTAGSPMWFINLLINAPTRSPGTPTPTGSPCGPAAPDGRCDRRDRGHGARMPPAVLARASIRSSPPRRSARDRPRPVDLPRSSSPRRQRDRRAPGRGLLVRIVLPQLAADADPRCRRPRRPPIACRAAPRADCRDDRGSRKASSACCTPTTT